MSMRYRITCLTPTLVGDGQKLAPIDYMVWKDQVNILDQRRIFRLLSKGPRLDSYLAQLKKADKLDFASWGGFAQNFAGRRIPFESPALTRVWESVHSENLFIPTFAAGSSGPYVPGTALKGALRTALVFSRSSPGALKDLAARMESDRPPRRLGEVPEERALGSSGTSRTKALAIGDSGTSPASVMRVYLTRVSTLQTRGQNLALGWKVSPRGTANGSEEATPTFAEMAAPGAQFGGVWSERAFFNEPEILRALNWKEAPGRQRLFSAANDYAAAVLQTQADYAQRTGMGAVSETVSGLQSRLTALREGNSGCLLQLGWGGGLVAKTAWPDTNSEPFREVARQIGLYARAIQSGLPFPKTRRIVFQGTQPASMPGWVLLEII